MTEATTVPIYHHVDDGVFVTCRRPPSEGGSMTAKWDEVTCPDCLGVRRRRRGYRTALVAVFVLVLLLTLGSVVSILRDRHACSDAGGVYIRGHCIDRSVVINP